MGTPLPAREVAHSGYMRRMGPSRRNNIGDALVAPRAACVAQLLRPNPVDLRMVAAMRSLIFAVIFFTAVVIYLQIRQ